MYVRCAKERPILLLSVLYFVSLVIANHLKKVLDRIISNSQSGFITGRFIGENTRLIYDVMHYIESEDLTGQLLLINFEKAGLHSSMWFLVRTLLHIWALYKCIV